MKRLSRFLAGTCALALAGCPILRGEEETGSADEFRMAIPSEDVLKVAAPGDDAAGEAGVLRMAELGQRADLYVLTLRMTRTVNGSVWIIGAWLTAVTAFPPTTVETDRAVWGPHDGGQEKRQPEPPEDVGCRNGCNQWDQCHRRKQPTDDLERNEDPGARPA